MDLTKILAVSGKPGLYKMISQTKSGFIVESMTDGKRFPVFAHERVSTLEEISIFSTGEEDTPLKNVFKLIFDKLEGKQAMDPKSEPKELVSFFASAVPGYDAERVHASDIKKVLTWYNLLLEKGMMEFAEEEDKKEEAPQESPNEETEQGTVKQE